MSISARIAVLLLLLVTPPGREPAGAADTAPFTVAVLRRDGAVIPFSNFDGKDWKASWPEGLRFTEVPLDLKSIPREWWGKPGPPTQLTAWVNGVNRGVIRLHLGTLKLLRLMCGARVAVASDYRSAEPAPPASVQPYPKDGLAVSSDQPVDRIEVLAAGSPEWIATAREMTAEFDAAEERAARRFLEWKHPFTMVERRHFRPQLEALYRAPMDEAGWTAHYLEAVRLYPPGPDDRGCGLITSASGWMAIGPNGKRSFKLHARITYCDREGVSYMLPLGLVKARDRSYWVYQMSGYGREGYMIVRPRPKEIVPQVEFSADTCPL